MTPSVPSLELYVRSLLPDGAGQRQDAAAASLV